MRFEISHQIDIDAPPAAVWQHLVDTDAYGEWNPFIRRLTGNVAVGERLAIRIAPPAAREMSFRPVVLAVEAESELRWLGRVLIPGLFDGEHSFHLEMLPGGRTRFTQRERFRGLLVGFSKTTLAKTRDGFEQMNVGLKQRVEQALAVSPSRAAVC
jgi:hypothetical protein